MRSDTCSLQAIKTSADRGDYQDMPNQNFNSPAFQPSRLHQIILALDSRIVITTNFDKIYERYCLNTSAEGFKVVTYESPSLADELRSDTRLIIKAHGNIDDIQRMVFTRAEHHRIKQEFQPFYEMLKAVVLLNTVIFIGCSFEDPDVMLLLAEVKITASSDRPHYVLVREGSQSAFAVEDWQQTYNVRALQYGPDHGALIQDLEDFLQRVDAVRASLGP